MRPMPTPPPRPLTPPGDAAPLEPTHWLIPAASRNTPALQAALPRLRLPNLDRLMVHLRPGERVGLDRHQPATPFEVARARALGLPDAPGHIPWAAYESQTWGTPCAWVQPCHWQVGTDRILMGDPEALQLRASEADALRAAMRPYFEEDGIALTDHGTPGAWLATGEVFRQLPTASLARVAGRNINTWLPDASTPTGATLRRLQNEMQMLLYTHPLNDEREARGQQVVNSFWLTGAGVLDAPPPAGATLAVDDRLASAARHDDAEAWLAAWSALDAELMPQLLRRVQRGEPLRLTLCGDRAAQYWQSQGPRGIWHRFSGLFGRQPTPRLLELL